MTLDVSAGGGIVQLSVKRTFGRYTALFVGLGAAGLAIGWLSPDITAVLMADRLS
jgi:hypothetical protein